MRINTNPVMIVLGIILVALGIGSFFGYRLFPNTQTYIYVVFGLAAVVLFLVLAGNVKENIGMIIIALWLLMLGLLAQFNISFRYSDIILSILPLAGGGFILLGL